MERLYPIWYGVGFSIVPFLVLILGYVNIHPELYRGVPRDFGARNDSSVSGIAWSDKEKEDPPLEYISDSFAAIGITTEAVEVKSFWDLWNAPVSHINYEWRYKVRNATDERLSILVEYKLEGVGGEVISSAKETMLAEPDEMIEFREFERINYKDAHRVVGSTWSISRRPVP